MLKQEHALYTLEAIEALVFAPDNMDCTYPSAETVAAISRFCTSPAVMVTVVYAIALATVVVGSVTTLEETVVVVLRLLAFPKSQVVGQLTFLKLLAPVCL